MIRVTHNPLTTPVGKGVLKATYEVYTWPADTLFLMGTPDEVFDALDLTRRGKRQKAFLAAAAPGDVAVFLNGYCVLLGPTPETVALGTLTCGFVPTK